MPTVLNKKTDSEYGKVDVEVSVYMSNRYKLSEAKMDCNKIEEEPDLPRTVDFLESEL